MRAVHLVSRAERQPIPDPRMGLVLRELVRGQEAAYRSSSRSTGFSWTAVP